MRIIDISNDFFKFNLKMYVVRIEKKKKPQPNLEPLSCFSVTLTHIVSFLNQKCTIDETVCLSVCVCVSVSVCINIHISVFVYLCVGVAVCWSTLTHIVF